jgi:hypothetical protein
VNLVDHWAESVLSSVTELLERLDAQTRTLNTSTLHAESSLKSKDMLNRRIEELEKLVEEKKVREKVLEAKIGMLGKDMYTYLVTIYIHVFVN